MAGARLAGLASLLLEAHRTGVPAPTGAHALLDAGEAYAIQDAVLQELSGGRRATIWKAIPPRGGQPLASPVPAQGTPAGSFLGVEAEIGFRLDDDLQACEAVALIEVCATRLAGWKEASALWKLADFQSHQAFVIGGGTGNWRAIDFARQAVELTVNGVMRATATGGHPSGDPSRLLPWLVQHARHRGGLQAGDIVATGSWVGIVPAQPGDKVIARFAGIGEAQLHLGAPDPRQHGLAAGEGGAQDPP